MQKEQTYGNSNWTGGDYGYVTNQPFVSVQGPQEEQSLRPGPELSEFITSDKRLDNYHLHFSSRL